MKRWGARLLAWGAGPHLGLCAVCGRYTTESGDRRIGDHLYCPRCHTQVLAELHTYHGAYPGDRP